MDRKQQTLATFGYAFEELPNLKTVPYIDYVTADGRILKGLPADAYHLARYLSRGLKPITANSKPQGLVCEICGKEFKLPIALAGHKRTHKK